MADHPRAAAPAGDAPAARSFTLLVVEDDPQLSPLLEAIARAAGFAHLATVVSGEAALELAPRADVVLLDHLLEGEVTGVDVLARIRERGLPAKVVLVTGHGSEQLAAQALRAGADDYVMKNPSLPQVLPGVLGRVRHLCQVEGELEGARARLVAAERLAAIAEVAVALSHEVNNPLQALRAELDLLRLQAAALPADVRGRVDAALAQVTRVTDVLRRVAALDRDVATSYVGGKKMTDLSRG
jgi:DNA-binding response OmpR family regulator